MRKSNEEEKRWKKREPRPWSSSAHDSQGEKWKYWDGECATVKRNDERNGKGCKKNSFWVSTPLEESTLGVTTQANSSALTACILACSSGLQYSFRISRHSTRQNTFQLYTVTVRTGRRSDWITRSREKPWHSHPWSDGKSLVGSLGCYALFSEEEKTAYVTFWLAVAVSCCL